MRRVGDEIARLVEDRAGKVEPFLDVHAPGGVGERRAHLVGDRHEQVVENLEQHRVGFRPGGGRAALGGGAGEHEVAGSVDFGRPVRFDHVGAGRLADDRGANDARARPEGRAVVERHLLPAVEPGADPVDGRAVALGRGHRGRGAGVAHRLYREHVEDDRAFGRDETEAGFVGLFEGRLHLVLRAESDVERLVRAFVAQMRAAADLDLGHALGAHLGARLIGQRVQPGARLIGSSERRVELRLAQGADIGEPHAEGGQYASVWMQEHPLHAQRVGDETGVLPAGAAEALQRITCHVMAALDADLLDRGGHVVDRDPEEAARDLFGRHLRPAGGSGDLGCQPSETRAHHFCVERRVGPGPEDGGEMRRLQPAEHHVAVGHRERPAAAVAGGTGIGAGALGADLEPAVAEGEDRAATGRHRMDVHHRRAHPHPGDLGLEAALIGAGVMAHVRAGAAHVEADEPLVPGRLGRAYHADDPARRPRQDRVLALEQVRVGEPAVRLHEVEPMGRAPEVERALHLGHVAAQDRREVGVDHGGVAAADKLGEARDLVTGRDLGEAGGAGEICGPDLVVGGDMGVQEGNGDGLDPRGPGGTQSGVERRLVQLCDHVSVGVEAFPGFDDPLVEQLRAPDLQGKQLGAGLSADPEKIAEAFCDHKQHPLALALQKRVGGDGGAHLDRADRPVGNRIAGGQRQAAPDPFDRRIAVLLRVLRQELGGLDPAIGGPRDHVGEGAAAVDPEFPLSGGHCALPWSDHGSGSGREMSIRAGRAS